MRMVNAREAIIEESVSKAKQRYPEIDHIVYIGDAIWDVKTTRRMQMNLVGMRVQGDVEVLEREGVTHV